jgi:tRNA/rRNA methyltransferase
MAKHAEDLLDSARVFTDVGAALADADLVIGTTARTRKYNQEHLFPKQIRDVLKRRVQSVSQVALVFGTESRGLSNEELELCDLLTTLPMAKAGAALNLAQAVMVYAYELSQLSLEEDLPHRDRGAENPTLREQVNEMLMTLKIDRDPLFENRINERLALLDDRDLKLFHYLRKAVVKRCK